MHQERLIGSTIAHIQKAFEYGELGEFEPGHGYEHHQKVVDDAVQIYTEDKVDADIALVIVAAYVHDWEQRGDLDRQQVENFLLESGLSEPFVKRVSNTVEQHSLNGNPQGTEPRLLWAADKANYPDIERFKEVAESLSAIDDLDARQMVLDKINAKYRGDWVNGVTNIPNSEIMQEFPTALRLFESRFETTLEYVQGEGKEFFGSWAEAYDNAIASKLSN